MIIDDSNSPIGIDVTHASGGDHKGEFYGSPIKYAYFGRNMGDDSSGSFTNSPNFNHLNEAVFGDSCTSMYFYYNLRNSKKVGYKSINVSRLKIVTLGKNLEEIVSFSESTNLEKVYVRATTPQEAKGFANYTYINGTLYVPRGTLKAYQEADVWKEFWNIEEYDVPDHPTAVKKVEIESNDEIIGIYDIKGIRHANPVKGLNIYKYKDGRVRKRYVK